MGRSSGPSRPSTADILHAAFSKINSIGKKGRKRKEEGRNAILLRTAKEGFSTEVVRPLKFYSDTGSIIGEGEGEREKKKQRKRGGKVR